MNSDCPSDDELLAYATDDQSGLPLCAHVEQCANCKMRVKLLTGEVAELRTLQGSLAEKLRKTILEKPANDVLTTGTVIGRYSIVGNLGSGGQADVYRIIDSELERFLVLKLSRRPSGLRVAGRDAMLAEGRLLAGLDHPGLVRIFDVGIHESRPYLVLEHVPGRNLEQAFSNKKPAAQQAAKLIAEMAHAVAYAHHHGVVHGDITPRNILIDGSGRPRLIDFGLSKMEDAWGEDSGPRGGTPEFLAPENGPVNGRLGQSVPAGDVFGLGATLFWMLTGQRPFEASTLAESLERSRKCDIDLDALSRANVPSRIARICRQSLSATPGMRPDPEKLARELERATRPWITPVSLSLMIVIPLISGILLVISELQDSSTADNGSIIHSSPSITIFRGEAVRTLSNEIPLHTGDHIAISCNMSPGQHAVLLWFNSVGELNVLTPVRDIADTIDRLVYPAPRRSLTLEAPEGTEMIFFCRGPDVPDDLAASFPMGTRLPQIPPQNWLILQRSGVRIEGTLQADIPDELSKLEQIMKDIDRKLRKQFPGVTGLAFPHHPAIAIEP